MSTKTKPSAKILQAMELIGSPEKWTKGEFARDLDGIPVSVSSTNAACFCSVGALNKVKADCFAKHYVNSSTPDTSIIGFNDSSRTTHKGVMKMFMTAAFLALSEGK